MLKKQVEKLEKKRAALMSQIEKLKKAALVKGDHSKVIFEFHAFPFRLRKQSA